MITAEKLKSLTDSALFETIANAVLRYKFPSLENIIVTGLNEKGETIKDAMDAFSEIAQDHFETDSFKNIVEVCKTGISNLWENHYAADGLDIYNEMGATMMDSEVIVHFTDFTKLKNLQLELERKIIELERSNKNLEEFAYAASHDLQEPIRKIHFYSNRLKESLKNKITASEIDYFDRLEIASKRMSSLIEDLLSYSQVSLRPKNFEEVDVNEVIALVMNDLDLEIDQKGAKITVEKLCLIQGYYRQLQQAFHNLIANSLKYCKPDVPPEIAITCRKLQGREIPLLLSGEEKEKTFWLIQVRDNGIGFEQVDAQRIFNVFTRLHGNSEYRGTGVGLSIVRKVIENHNGHITANGFPGQGSIFEIYLPAE